MVTEVISDETLPVAGVVRGERTRHGLTSAPAALLAVFDRIEQAVAADCRPAAISAQPRRLRMDLRSPGTPLNP
jgi:hypothetical protein